MNLEQIVAAEAEGARAIRTLRPYMEAGPRKDAADRAILLLAEARQFAVCWDDIRSMQDKGTCADEKATALRQQVIQRIMTLLAPDR